jgi:flagellar protein FlaG
MAVIENIRPVDVTPLRTQPVAPASPDRSREQETSSSIKLVEDRSESSADLEQPTVRPSNETVAKAVDQMNQLLDVLNKDISFFFDEASRRSGVKVIDRQTHEVLKQIPPEEILKTAARIREMVGALLDERA